MPHGTWPRWAAVVAVLAALVLAACGGDEDAGTGAGGTRTLDLMLDYFPNADHAGIYGAIASGAVERAGVELRLRTPSDPAAPLKLLQAGRVDLAISYEPELLLARDRGAEDLVAIAAIVQAPLTSLVSLEGRVTRPEDLRGARVATAGIPYQAAYLRTILEEAGLPADAARPVDVGFDLVRPLVSGRADAALGAFWNYEGTQLRLDGRDPTILRMERLGVPVYDELVLVARRETVERDGPRLRRLLAALAGGHEALARDPAPALDALLEANPDLERPLQEAVVEATLPVFLPDDAPGWGHLDAGEWERYAAWMAERGLLEGEPDGRGALTTALLPAGSR